MGVQQVVLLVQWKLSHQKANHKRVLHHRKNNSLALRHLDNLPQMDNHPSVNVSVT